METKTVWLNNSNKYIAMTEDEIFEIRMNKFIQRLRPVIYEAVNDCLSKIQIDSRIQEVEDSLWSIKDVMKYFGCAKTTVFKWRTLGLIKSHKIGNKVYYKKADILKSLKNREKTK